MKKTPARKLLEKCIEAMPEEAFGYIAQALWLSPVTHSNRVFPDGIGGFTPESRAAIIATQAAANDYVTQPPPK